MKCISAAIALLAAVAVAGCGSSTSPSAVHATSASTLHTQLQQYGDVSAMSVQGDCTSFDYRNAGSSGMMTVDVCRSDLAAREDLGTVQQAAAGLAKMPDPSGSFGGSGATDASIRIGNVVIEKTADDDASDIRAVL